jgi:hypothetical protein
VEGGADWRGVGLSGWFGGVGEELRVLERGWWSEDGGGRLSVWFGDVGEELRVLERDGGGRMVE